MPGITENLQVKDLLFASYIIFLSCFGLGVTNFLGVCCSRVLESFVSGQFFIVKGLSQFFEPQNCEKEASAGWVKRSELLQNEARLGEVKLEWRRETKGMEGRSRELNRSRAKSNNFKMSHVKFTKGNRVNSNGVKWSQMRSSIVNFYKQTNIILSCASTKGGRRLKTWIGFLNQQKEGTCC